MCVGSLDPAKIKSKPIHCRATSTSRVSGLSLSDDRARARTEPLLNRRNASRGRALKRKTSAAYTVRRTCLHRSSAGHRHRSPTIMRSSHAMSDEARANMSCVPLPASLHRIHESMIQLTNTMTVLMHRTRAPMLATKSKYGSHCSVPLLLVTFCARVHARTHTHARAHAHAHTHARTHTTSRV